MPKKAAQPDQAISEEDIARRAYEISLGPEGGTDEENWLRAERELRSERNSDPFPEQTSYLS